MKLTFWDFFYSHLPISDIESKICGTAALRMRSYSDSGRPMSGQPARDVAALRRRQDRQRANRCSWYCRHSRSLLVVVAAMVLAALFPRAALALSAEETAELQALCELNPDVNGEYDVVDANGDILGTRSNLRMVQICDALDAGIDPCTCTSAIQIIGGSSSFTYPCGLNCDGDGHITVL